MMTSAHAQANVAPGAEDAAAAGHSMPVPASPAAAEDIQREMEHLREMVFALSREVASERAARDRFRRTVDAWEDPGDSTNGTWTGGIGAAADEEVGSQSGDSPNAPLFGSTDSSHAPEAAASYSRNRANVTHTETPPGRRVHFMGSPGADDQPPEDHESMHAPEAAALHQPKAGVMRIDGSAKWWQDPWTQAVDPWTPWWGYTAPLRTPPGMVPPAASEQWADRADAHDDWRLSEAIGDHGWKTQWHNWSWPTNSYGWSSSGPKFSLDKKDTEKPEKYGGDI